MAETNEKLAAEGWSQIEDDGFIGLIGPFWRREQGGARELALATAEKHRNRSGIVQGGVICALADRAPGTASRALTGNRPQVTIKLDMTFLDRIEVGDLIVTRPRILRQSRSLNFGQVDLVVADGLCASATGIFRLL
jgi:acyl-coenzyme A thioesterase PaaI-like protein